MRIESSSSSVSEGQTLDLNCIVAGQASGAVTWYRRGGSLPAGHQVPPPHSQTPQPEQSTTRKSAAGRGEPWASGVCAVGHVDRHPCGGGSTGGREGGSRQSAPSASGASGELGPSAGKSPPPPPPRASFFPISSPGPWATSADPAHLCSRLW